MGKVLSRDIEVIIQEFKEENKIHEALNIYYNIKNLTLKSIVILLENEILTYDDFFYFLKFFESSSKIRFSKDEFENIQRMKQIQPKNLTYLKKEKEKEKELIEEANKIIQHLNKILNKRYKTETYLSIILSLLKKGYSYKDFVNVHLYYLYRWGLSNKMSPYLRPKTLYNKFDERVYEANVFWERLKNYKNEIEYILNTFYKLEQIYFEKTLKKGKKQEEINVKTLISYVQTIEKRSIIASWLEKGYSVEDISFTISIYFEKYGTDEKILPHITLEKILDEKFPKRFEGAKKIKLIADNAKIDKENHNQDVLTQWLKNQKKG